MVYFMENLIKMDDLGGNICYFWVDTHIGDEILPSCIGITSSRCKYTLECHKDFDVFFA